MILSSNVGRTRLWKGQPFLARTTLGPGPNDRDRGSIESGLRNEEIYGAAMFRGVDPPSAAERQATALSNRLPADIIAAETLDMAPGIYEVTLARGPDRIRIPELVWLLEREDYSLLARAEGSEGFSEEPIASVELEFARLFFDTVAARWPACPVAFEVSWKSDTPICYSPVRWTLEGVLDSFRYLSVFGLQGASGFVSVSDRILEMGIEAAVECPLPDAVIETFYDAECGDLQLLDVAGDLPGVDLDIHVERGRARIAVRHPVTEPQPVYA